jgi:hypothetical protein
VTSGLDSEMLADGLFAAHRGNRACIVDLAFVDD